jgi:peptidylprolyl isomerase
VAVGVPPKHPDRLLHVRVLADLPAGQRPDFEALDVHSPQFNDLVAQARKLHGADFSVCDVSVPVRRTP